METVTVGGKKKDGYKVELKAKNTGRRAALAAAIGQVEKRYGIGSVLALDGSVPEQHIDVIPTGSLALDRALGIGGFARGRIIEVYGPEGSGKTTLALSAIAECQKMGGTAVMIDVENSLDREYAGHLGVHIGTPENPLIISQPDSGEEALEIMEAFILSSAVDLVVLDSVAALVPRAEIEGDMGDTHVGLQARLMSQAMRKLAASINKTKTCAIFINQIRMRIGVMFGNPETTPGGRALKFYASQRVDVRAGAKIKGPGKDKGAAPIGHELRLKVVKNKLAPPFRIASSAIIYGRGLDRIGELIDLAEAQGVITRKGAFYYLGEGQDPPEAGTMAAIQQAFSGKLPDGAIAQGRDALRGFLRENGAVAKAIEEGLE